MARDERILTIRQSARALFADPTWPKKAGLGVAVSLIPYVGAVWLMGYGLTYLHSAAWDPASRLPEWPPHGERLKTGLNSFVVGMVYSLPLSIVLAVIIVMMSAGGVFALEAADFDPTGFAIVMVAGGVLMSIVMFAYAAAIFPVYAHVTLYGSIEAGFDVKRILARTRESAPAFWTAYRRSFALMMLSTVAVLVVFAGVIAASATMTTGSMMLLPEGAQFLVIPGFFLTELVGFAAALCVQLPVALMNYRLWASYARAAYGLDAARGGLTA